jgi:hypothetical protein
LNEKTGRQAVRNDRIIENVGLGLRPGGKGGDNPRDNPSVFQISTAWLCDSVTWFRERALLLVENYGLLDYLSQFPKYRLSVIAM